MSEIEDQRLVDPSAALARIRGGALTIDVRGIDDDPVPGAIAVDRNRLPELFSETSPERLPELESPDQEIVVYCASERGSAPVAEWLARAGFTNVVHVDGGIAALRAAQGSEDPPR